MRLHGSLQVLDECTFKYHRNDDGMLLLQATYPAFGTPHVEGVNEVHLRRLDGPGTLHRRAVAVIKIHATCAEVSADSFHCHQGICIFIPYIGPSTLLMLISPLGEASLQGSNTSRPAYTSLLCRQNLVSVTPGPDGEPLIQHGCTPQSPLQAILATAIWPGVLRPLARVSSKSPRCISFKPWSSNQQELVGRLHTEFGGVCTLQDLVGLDITECFH